MAWTRELGGFEQRIGSGQSWTRGRRSDPQGAIAWAKENFEGRGQPLFHRYHKRHVRDGYDRGYRFDDFDALWSLAGRAASILLERSWTQGEEAAMTWAENLPDGSFQKLCLWADR